MSKNIYLTEAEEKLAKIIWQERSLTSPDLVALANEKLGWKKSTTYTILKKLCDKGITKNQNANVSVVLTYEEQKARQSHCYIEDVFGGSLPMFINSFFRGKEPSKEEILSLKQLIDNYDEDRVDD
jgi:predicted transcriptional regulator